MSLINDALKKAQQQRAPSPAATSSVSGAQPKKKTTFRIVTVIGLCAVLLSAVSVGTTLFILHDDSAAPARTPAKSVTVATTPLPTPAEAPKKAASAPLPSTTTAALPSVATPTPAPIAFPSPPTIAPVTNPAQEPKPTIVAAPVVRPPDPPQPSAGVQSFVDKFRVAGIRVSDTESKVILNEHLFHLNDMIEPGLGLRLTGIDSHLLTFTDSSGFSYQKRF